MLKLNRDRLSIGFFFATGLIFALLILRITYLQLWKGAEYKSLSENVRARVIPRIAPRGRIYDRFGKIVAESRIVYDVYVLPYQLKDPQVVFNFLRMIGFDTRTAGDVYWNKKYLPYQSVLVQKNISLRDISLIEENREILTGVMIGSRVIRHYPYDRLLSHVIGYVGQINAEELGNLKNYGYKIGDIIGMSGIERYYDQYLKGINGGQPLEVDPLGNPVRQLSDMEPIPGADIQLTIDLDFQRYAEKVFGNNKGAAVALDPRTGEVLMMFSKPDYNPNYFTDVLTEKQWQEIISQEHPLHDRALTGYPPGSVFKIVTSLAALEAPDFNRNQNYFCPGYLRLGGRRFNCWVGSGHGKLNFYEGFMQSCNVVFYNLGLFLGPDRIAQAAAAFGLGMATNIDQPFESAGLIPTQKWKKRIYNEDWYPGDSANMAIGQGFILTTPLQMATVVASVANFEHEILRPFLAKKITSSADRILMEKEKEVVSRLPFDPKNIELVRNLMHQVVSKGTGKNAKVNGFEICGKTGTAEIFKPRKTHAWFVSFAPYENPEIV
jgi:penicillin-binding protein 2